MRKTRDQSESDCYRNEGEGDGKIGKHFGFALNALRKIE